MITCYMLLLFFAFLAWSIFLRFLAIFLIQDCISKQKTNPAWLCITDVIGAIAWLSTMQQLSDLFPAYCILLTALYITILTDFQHMLISRFASLYLIPVGIIFAYANIVPINTMESFLASLFGYGFLWIANKIFYLLKKHDGLGQGDLEFIACIASFTGFLGCWFTILFGSITGTMCGAIFLTLHKQQPQIMPFGPFLAISAWIFILFQAEIVQQLLIWTY